MPGKRLHDVIDLNAAQPPAEAIAPPRQFVDELRASHREKDFPCESFGVPLILLFQVPAHEPHDLIIRE